MRRLVGISNFLTGQLSLDPAERDTHRVDECIREQAVLKGWTSSVASTKPAGGWYWKLYQGELSNKPNVGSLIDSSDERC